MNPDRLEYFRNKLETIADELGTDLNEGDEATAVVQLDTAIGRLSRMDSMQSQQMALELQRRKQKQLQSVQNALKRIDQGTYGLCGLCQTPINNDRLDFQPDALLCVQCADGR